jgi:competence ComEA-like helix-hairpin-helix protein
MKRWMTLALLPLALPVLAEVNVNTAQQSELERTKGLDRTKAKAIIEYRAQTGTVFDSLDDLEKVPGLDKSSIDKAAPQITFDGPPYTPPAKAAAPKKNTRGQSAGE